MQDMYVKISGGMSSLRSFRAIFSRPKLPGGVRRDPRPKPAVLDSNREGIASWGESPLTCNRPHIHRTSKTEKDAVGDGIPKATASRGTGAANYGTNHCEDKLDDARSSVPPSSTETASGGFDEFQDQRQRQNARKNASGATSRGAHKIKSQTAPSIIPHNVFGAVPQPASALPTPTVTEAQSNSDQDIAALRFATSNNTQHDQRSRTRAASAELKSNTQSNPSVRANPSTPQLGKEHSAKPTVDLPDVRSEKEKLPAGWQQVVSEDGSVYYYHTLTRVSRCVLSLMRTNVPYSLDIILLVDNFTLVNLSDGMTALCTDGTNQQRRLLLH